ncbi:MAG: hypothetical protein ACLFS1_11330 [Opitutales bacterium]
MDIITTIITWVISLLSLTLPAGGFFVFDLAILHKPDHANAHYGRIMLYFRKDDLAGAENALRVFAENVDTTDPISVQFLEKAKTALRHEKALRR